MRYLINLIQQFNRQICQLFRNDICSFSFAVLFISCLLLFIPRSYSVNDNVGILFDATGGFISEFTSFFYMKLLHFLYQMSNDIPWYGLTLYFTHILSLFIFVRSLARIKNFEIFFIPFLIIYLYLYSFFITQVDYTSTSIMVGANSLFAFLVFLNNGKMSIFYVLGLGLLFSLSFSIRMPGTFAVLVYGLPIIGSFLIDKSEKATYFLIFFMPFLLLLIGENLARTYLTSPEYQQYHEFNSLRGQLHDNPILKDNQNNHKILEANNWTQDDYNNFKMLNFFDERKYNTTTLNNVFKYSVLQQENKIQKYNRLYSQTLYKLITHPENKWPIYFLLLISMLIIFKFYWFLVLIIFCYLSYAISLSIYLDIFYRFPIRIAHPILLICASFLILLIFNLFSHQFPAKNTNHSIFAMTFVFCIFWFMFNTGMRHNLNTDVFFNPSIKRLQSAYQDKILYIPPSVLQWEKMDPLKRYHFNFHKIAYAGGTGTFSPGFYKELEKLGVKKGYEMIPGLINNPNAYIVEMKTNPYCVTPHIMENYNLECDGVIIEQLPNDRVVIKLSPKQKTPP